MHTNDTVSLRTFIEESINFQNEEVYVMYGLIFSILSIICIVNYQLARIKDSNRNQP